MSMLSGTVLGPSGDGPRKRHPVATGAIVVLMMAVLFGATFGAVRLLRGSSTPEVTGPTAAPCVTTTVRPGLVLPKPGTVTTNVFNATDRAGLAKKTSTDLKSRGFLIGRVANDPLGKTVATVGEIRYGPSGKANAQLMSYYVVGATLVLDQRTDATIDVVIGAKFTAVAPQKTVDAALAKPVPVESGAGCASPSASTSPSTSPSTSTGPTPSAS
jgi:hypothetical protein